MNVKTETAGMRVRPIALYLLVIAVAVFCSIAAVLAERFFTASQKANANQHALGQAQVSLALIERELASDSVGGGSALRSIAAPDFVPQLEAALASVEAATRGSLRLVMLDQTGAYLAGASNLHPDNTHSIPWRIGVRSGSALFAPGVAAGVTPADSSWAARGLGALAGLGLLALGALLANRRYNWLHYFQNKRTGDLTGENRTLRRKIGAGHETERALQRYEQIVSTSPDLIAVLDRNCRYLAVNRRFETVYSKPAGEIVGCSIAEVAGKQTEDDFREHVAQAMDGESTTLRAWRELPGGGLRFLDSHFSPYLEPDGSIAGALVCTRDVTDLKRALDALSESETRFRALVEATSDWVWEVDENAVYTYASPKVKELLGREPSEILGKTPFDLMASEEADRVSSEFAKIAQSQQAFSNLENVNLTKDGTEVVLETSGVPVFAPDGRFCGFRGIDRDITGRKLAGQLLTMQRETLERIALGRSLATILKRLTSDLLGFLPARWCAILLLDGDQLHLAASSGLSGSALQKMNCCELVEGHSPCADAVLADSPVIVPDFAQDARWQPMHNLAPEENPASFWSFPIRINHVAVGSITVALEFSAAPDDQYREIMEMASNLAGVAIERSRAQSALEENAQHLQSLSQKLLDAQEQERRRIARELHDEVGQALTALKLNLHTVEGRMPAESVDNLLGDSMDIVELVLRQIRSLSLDLRPPMLDDLGLSSALEWYLSRQRERSGLSIQFHSAKDDLRLVSEIETACFRIAQEAVTNVIRHASAQHLRVELQVREKQFVLLVSDDGGGFDVRRATRLAATGRSVGLLGMQERAALAGGQVEVVSNFRGTDVRAIFPLRPARREALADA